MREVLHMVLNDLAELNWTLLRQDVIMFVVFECCISCNTTFAKQGSLPFLFESLRNLTMGPRLEIISA